MKRIALFAFIFLSVFLATACGQSNSEPEEKGKDNGQIANDENIEQENNKEKVPAEDKQAPVLLPEKQVTVTVEGMKDKRMAFLFQSNELGFSTYIPENLTADKNDQSLIAYANNADSTKNPHAKFQISTANAETDLKQMLKSEGFTVTKRKELKLDYSKLEYSLKKEEAENSIVGFASEFEKHGQTYYLIYHYPIEYGDGFEPSANVILNEMIWHE